MQIKQGLMLLFISFLLATLPAKAQNIKSAELMYLAQEVHSLIPVVESHRKTPGPLKPYMWSSIGQDILENSMQYRMASVEMAIVEKNSPIDLRQYRFGNRNANQNNMEEAQTEILVAWLSTKELIKFYKTIEDDAPAITLIRKRLEEVADRLQPYAQTIVNRMELKKN